MIEERLVWALLQVLALIQRSSRPLRLQFLLPKVVVKYAAAALPHCPLLLLLLLLLMLLMLMLLLLKMMMLLLRR